MSDPHWLTNDTIDKNAPKWVFGMNKDYFILGMKTVLMFLLFFILLTINLLALSVSLQCNRGTNKQTFSAIFAFFFGPIYLIMNYYFIRVLYKGESCQFSNVHPFPYMS